MFWSASAEPSGCAVALVRSMLLVLVAAGCAGVASAQEPRPDMMDTPGVRVLKGLTVPEFDDEMKGFVQALGVAGCGYCHVARNFPSEDKPAKQTARRMIEMTKAINQQFYPDFRPEYGESKLGKVTCYTCHQGAAQPKNGTQ